MKGIEGIVRLADNAPLPVAHPFKVLEDSLGKRGGNPRHSLFDLCIAIEATLRFLVALALTECTAQMGGKLPDQTARQLRPLIKAPTMAAWKHILVSLVQAPGYTPRFLPEIGNITQSLQRLFEVHGEPRAPNELPAIDIVTVRNQLAHGIGMDSGLANQLLAFWLAEFDAALESMGCLAEIELWVGTLESTRKLQGYLPDGVPGKPPEEVAARLATGESTLAYRQIDGESVVVQLAPINRWGRPSEMSRAEYLHLYARFGDLGLLYDLIGDNAALQAEGPEEGIRQFEALFSIRKWEEQQQEKRFQVPGHEPQVLADARRSGDFVGRAAQWDALWAAVNEMTSGVLWLSGVAGIGKSSLMTRLAAALWESIDDAPDNLDRSRKLMVYRFSPDRADCNLVSLMTWLSERLALEPVRRTFDPQVGLQKLPSLFEACPADQVLILLDGLDELSRREPRFVERDLARLIRAGSQKTLFVIASRNEAGIESVLTALGARMLFPGGLPPMNAAEVRAMIDTNGHHQGVRRLMKFDKETNGAIMNPLVDLIVERSEGLPIYVRLLLKDIGDGKVSLDALANAEALPQGLNRYFTNLCRRDHLGDGATTPSFLVVLLAYIGEPVSNLQLAALVRRCGGEHIDLNEQELQESVVGAVHALSGLLRPAITEDGAAGYRLFHTEFQDFVQSDKTWSVTRGLLTAPLIGAVTTPGDGAEATPLYRQGIRLLVDCRKAGDALAMACRAEYQYARLTILAPDGGDAGFVKDWFMLQRLDKGLLDASARKWCAFWLSEGRAFRRTGGTSGAGEWVFRTSLYSPDDVIGRAATTHLPKVRRPHPLPLAAFRNKSVASLVTLRGHSAEVSGVLQLRDGRLLSWSSDETLRLWSEDGEFQRALHAHHAAVFGALQLRDGRLLSWSSDATLCLWSEAGEFIRELPGHGHSVLGALQLRDGRVLSWAMEGSLRLWSEQGEYQGELRGHLKRKWVMGALQLRDGRLLSWSEDRTLRLWSPDGEFQRKLSGTSQSVEGAQELRDGRLLSLHYDGKLGLWSEDGEFQRELSGHSEPAKGALELRDGRLLSWSSDDSSVDGTENSTADRLCFWSDKGEFQRGLRGHVVSVHGVLELRNGHLLSWSRDATLRLWSEEGEFQRELLGHSECVNGALQLRDGQLLSWSTDHTLRLWSEEGEFQRELAGHSESVEGAIELRDGRFLSWARDATLCLWSAEDALKWESPEHSVPVDGAQQLRGGRMLSWSNNEHLSWYDRATLRLWSEDGEFVRELPGRREPVRGMLQLRDGRLLFWSSAPEAALTDVGLRLWSEDGKYQRKLSGHCGSVDGALQLRDGRLLSWAFLDQDLCVWSEAGEFQRKLPARNGAVNGALQLRDDRLLSWSSHYNASTSTYTGTLCLRSEEGEYQRELTGHNGSVEGALQLRNGRLLSWSEDTTLRLWTEEGEFQRELSGHSECVNGALQLRDGQLLSWSKDRTLRLWSEEGEFQRELMGHSESVDGALQLRDGRLLSWSNDATLGLWSLSEQADSPGFHAWAVGRVLGCFPLPSSPYTLLVLANDGARGFHAFHLELDRTDVASLSVVKPSD